MSAPRSARREKTMSEKVYDVPADWARKAWVDDAKYLEMYDASVKNPDSFWAEHGKRIDWFQPFTKVKNASFAEDNVSIQWFEDGVTNVAYNCIDRHLPKRADQTAIIWEGDDPSQSRHITYAELANEVGRFANVLKKQGVKKGDRWPARGSERSIPWCSAASRPTRWRGGSRARTQPS
jgi:acetyl-CoA synthetase